MGKPGPKPKKIIDERWSSNLAYAIGLIATDGCLAPGHGIDLTSKDRAQLLNFKKCTGITNKITTKYNGMGMPYLHIQFRSVLFYQFLLSIGLTPAKSKTIGVLKIPGTYFFDFLRGVFDGDGCTYSYWDKRWRSSFMFYLCFASASRTFIDWLQETIKKFTGSNGHITKDGNGSTYQLKYAKAESLKVIKKMYYSPKVICLSRKRLKIKKMLDIVGGSLK